MVHVNQLNYKSDLPKARISLEDPLAIEKFSWDLTYKLLKLNSCKARPIVLVCIGTDRSTGDCLGPLVGSKLHEENQDFYQVYGTLDKPVHASNLNESLKEIYDYYENPLVIAIDACLGQLDNVGTVNIGAGELKPGAGVNKDLPGVGELHITGIVNVGGFMEYLVLQNTRLNLVMRLADLIKSGLLAAMVEYRRTKAQGM